MINYDSFIRCDGYIVINEIVKKKKKKSCQRSLVGIDSYGETKLGLK